MLASSCATKRSRASLGATTRVRTASAKRDQWVPMQFQCQVVWPQDTKIKLARPTVVSKVPLGSPSMDLGVCHRFPRPRTADAVRRRDQVLKAKQHFYQETDSTNGWAFKPDLKRSQSRPSWPGQRPEHSKTIAHRYPKAGLEQPAQKKDTTQPIVDSSMQQQAAPGQDWQLGPLQRIPSLEVLSTSEHMNVPTNHQSFRQKSLKASSDDHLARAALQESDDR